MSAFARGKQGFKSIYVPTRQGALIQRSTGTKDPRIVRDMKRMVNEIRDRHLWASLDAIQGKQGKRIDLASVPGTPLHYQMPYASEFPSGEALRKAETRFTSKVRARQMSFGQVWSDAMRLALRIDGADDLHLETRWIDPAAVSDRETLENLLLKRQIGLPAERALKEAGY
jgi:hypothetical protein